MNSPEEKKLYEKKVNDLIHSIGLSNNLLDSEVRKILESQFRFAYEVIIGLSLTGLTEDEINNLRTNFYFKYLGKLYTGYDALVRQKNREDYLNRLKEEDGRS